MLPTPSNYYEVVFTILFFNCQALYNYETLDSVILEVFPNYFPIEVSWLLLNYSSFSHDMTTDLSGNWFYDFAWILLSSFFHIQFKGHLIVSKTFFLVLMKCTPTLPKDYHGTTWSHQTENDILFASNLFLVSSLPQCSHFSKVLTIERKGCENPTCASAAFSLQPGTSEMLMMLLLSSSFHSHEDPRTESLISGV